MMGRIGGNEDTWTPGDGICISLIGNETIVKKRADYKEEDYNNRVQEDCIFVPYLGPHYITTPTQGDSLSS